MNCQEVRKVFHAYVDDELDVTHVIAIEEHLGQCPECSRLDQGLRSLKSTIAKQLTSYSAPKELRVVPESIPSVSTRPRHWFFGTRLAVTAMSLTIAALSFTLGMLMNFGSSPQGTLDIVVAAHVRSLQVEHKVDVASTDRHTVKPWFQGKVDFAPLVIDLSSDGFELAGGRLDYLTDRPVAAMIYFRRSHAINLFTWPVPSSKDSPVQRLSSQGFHIRTWTNSGMTYWAISDLNDTELDQFVQLFRTAGVSP